MTEASDAAAADRAVKTKHRQMWALGDYPAVASRLIPELGEVLTRACGVTSGQRVLDVAAGSGNAAIPAARAGAHVVASDLTPELLDVGRQLAREQGLELEWEEGDAEALPYADGDFDTVMSCVGVMFAPHHQATADELVRVCRTGGRIGLANWTPQGFIGQMFAALKPFAPPPPPGSQPPPLWGDEAHVRELFGDRITEVEARTRTVRVDRFERPHEFREFFKNCYGPTIAVYHHNAADPAKTESLDRELDALAERFMNNGAMDWEYLVFTARVI